METCYILFGSNMGDKEQTFAEARLLINNRCGRVTKVSSAYFSEPWGFEADEWFLNVVLEVETEMEPETLLRQLLDIEAELGRVRHPEKEGYSSRTADLDLLYYGNRVINTPFLTVPHPRLHRRRFTLLPLCEVAPDFVHPVIGLTQTALLERCADTLAVMKIETEKND